jgi:hypothetical protein
MGRLSRARRVRDDDRERAVREIKAAVGAIPDARLTELFDYEGAKNAPPPEAFGLSYRLLWRAMGQPRAMAHEDGSMAPDCAHEELSDINRRMIRVVQPLLDRIEVIDNRRRTR